LLVVVDQMPVSIKGLYVIIDSQTHTNSL